MLPPHRQKIHFHLLSAAEVAGVTFSDYNSAPVPKFLNRDPEVFRMWESDSCSNSSNHRGNRNSDMFVIKQRRL